MYLSPTLLSCVKLQLEYFAREPRPVFRLAEVTTEIDGEFLQLMKETATRMPKNRQFTLAGLKVDPKLLAGFADSFERLNINILTVHLRSGQSDAYREINACVLPLGETAVRG